MRSSSRRATGAKRASRCCDIGGDDEPFADHWFEKPLA
jgi:hypothetical protein